MVAKSACCHLMLPGLVFVNLVSTYCSLLSETALPRVDTVLQNDRQKFSTGINNFTLSSSGKLVPRSQANRNLSVGSKTVQKLLKRKNRKLRRLLADIKVLRGQLNATDSDVGEPMMLDGTQHSMTDISSLEQGAHAGSAKSSKLMKVKKWKKRVIKRLKRLRKHYRDLAGRNQKDNDSTTPTTGNEVAIQRLSDLVGADGVSELVNVPAKDLERLFQLLSKESKAKMPRLKMKDRRFKKRLQKLMNIKNRKSRRKFTKHSSNNPVDTAPISPLDHSPSAANLNVKIGDRESTKVFKVHSRHNPKPGEPLAACFSHKQCLPGHCCHQIHSIPLFSAVHDRTNQSTAGDLELQNSRSARSGSSSVCRSHMAALGRACTHSCQCAGHLHCFRTRKDRDHHKRMTDDGIMTAQGGLHGNDVVVEDHTKTRGVCKDLETQDLHQGDYVNRRNSVFMP